MNSLSAKSATKTIAAFMVFWLSGVLFLLCCGTMQSMAAKSEFCPLAAKGQSHCDKGAVKNDSPVVSKITQSQTLDCCGFLPAVFDKTRKIEKNQQTTQPADKIKVDLPGFSYVENSFETVADYHSPFLAQKKIFLKNCIFRI
jgi:hypothetical protein